MPSRDWLRRAKLAYAIRDYPYGNPGRVPMPSRDWLRRAKLAYAIRDYPASSRMSLSTPPAVTAGPAPGPVITSGLR